MVDLKCMYVLIWRRAEKDLSLVAGMTKQQVYKFNNLSHWSFLA